MKPRDTTLRLKRFEASEKARKVASLETMIFDFDQMAAPILAPLEPEPSPRAHPLDISAER